MDEHQTMQNFNLSNELNSLARAYLDALLSGRRSEAVNLIFQALDDQHSISDIYLNVFAVTQREIGHLWETNQISVAQEHYCTAVTQSLMGHLYPQFAVMNGEGKKIVMACVGGELHELGARMAADLFEMDGWHTYYIGANTPKESLLSTVKEQRPDILGLSVTMSHNLPQSMNIIQTIRSDPDLEKLMIMVGGRAYNIAPELWKKVGADLFSADILHAIEMANQITTQKKGQAL